MRLNVHSSVLVLTISAILFPVLGEASVSKARPSTPAPLSLSAEYYVDHGQFERALELYRQLVSREPEIPRYWQRMATLALYVEGRGAAQQAVQGYLNSPAAMGKRADESLDSFLEGLFGAFISDKGQALFLQAKVREDRADCAGAIPLYRQALDEEKSHLGVLRRLNECEMKMEFFPQAYESLKAAYALNPYSRSTAERLAEMHLYFGAVVPALEVTAAYSQHRPLTPRLMVAEAIAWSRKTEPEKAWLAFRKVDQQFTPGTIPPIVIWEKIKLLEGDARKKHAVSKTQMSAWLKQFLKNADAVQGFDAYRTATFKTSAQDALATYK